MNLKLIAGLIVIFTVILFIDEARAQSNYNLPRYSKVQIVRNPGGQSYLELKFHWSSENPPNFTSNIAVEFEIHLDNKCFVQPVGGKDDQVRCDKRLLGYYFPNEIVGYPEELPNCYVDVLNYWSPDLFSIGSYVQDRCGYINQRTMDCLSTLAAFGELTDQEGNFAVGVHDGSYFKKGETYWFRYPVEINNSSECDWAYKDRIDEGLVTVNMQTFSNFCLINPLCVDSWDDMWNSYACPELIGASEGCWNSFKSDAVWLNNLCAPTDLWEYTPGESVVETPSDKCEGGNFGEQHTEKSCCRDADNDGYFLDQEPVPTYGTRTGDCDDSNAAVNPGATDICGDSLDNDCDGQKPPSCLLAAGVDFFDPCTTGQTADCGNCGLATCDDSNQWGPCLGEGVCSPNSTTTQSCGTGGTQTSICQENCQWGPWGECQGGTICDCSSGECCNGCDYLPYGTACGSPSTIYQCQSASPGQDVQSATIQTYCSGYGSNCDGYTQQSSWQTWDDCSSGEICDDGYYPPQCVISCQDVFLADSYYACNTTPGTQYGYNICLEVNQLGGASWQYRICKNSGTFPLGIKYQLLDLNHLSQYLGGQYSDGGSLSCTAWRSFSASYISGYGSGNGAGLQGELIIPPTCTLNTCKYYTGMISLRKECQ